VYTILHWANPILRNLAIHEGGGRHISRGYNLNFQGVWHEFPGMKSEIPLGG
jgi:hypothetical protein